MFQLLLQRSVNLSLDNLAAAFELKKKQQPKPFRVVAYVKIVTFQVFYLSRCAYLWAPEPCLQAHSGDFSCRTVAVNRGAPLRHRPLDRGWNISVARSSARSCKFSVTNILTEV